MKTETYRKMETFLQELIVYKKILEIRDDEYVEKLVSDIENAMECLNETEQKIINDFYTDHKTMLEISQDIALTREYTSKVKTAAVRKLEKILFKDGAYS